MSAMPRIFDTSNALGTKVYDMDTKQEIVQVFSVEPDAGKVIVADPPCRYVHSR